mmetsp:Transcript_63338/g.188611  ORF Transcript_63338/g.188611 Transcript_63338/m.188611 type:complete len:234 (+) Transcript_63338:145-846(+)
MHRRRTLEPPYRHHDRLEGARVDRPLLPRCAVRIAPKANVLDGDEGHLLDAGVLEVVAHRADDRADRAALRRVVSPLEALAHAQVDQRCACLLLHGRFLRVARHGLADHGDGVVLVAHLAGLFLPAQHAHLLSRDGHQLHVARELGVLHRPDHGQRVHRLDLLRRHLRQPTPSRLQLSRPCPRSLHHPCSLLRLHRNRCRRLLRQQTCCQPQAYFQNPSLRRPAAPCPSSRGG